MSLTTSCPACGTLFRVVPDQLRISDGWVRCGKCAKVFDAQSQMAGAPVEARPAPTESTPAADVPAPASAAVDAAAPPAPAPSEPERPLAERLALIAAEIAQETAEAEAQEAELARQKASFRALAADEGTPPPASAPIPAVAPAVDASHVPVHEGEPTQPAFIQQAERRAFWRSGGVRTGLRLVCLLLVAGLGWQVAVHERDRLAAMWPALTPALLTLCAPQDCTVAPLRQIDAVVIDSSTFTRLQPTQFRLAVVLKNTATLPLAVPAVEVTLTDARDEAVVRRVVAPAVLSPGAPALAPGTELPGTLALTLADAEQGARVTGYRVLAFYP